ncbi:family 20 glycosylhydrolase [Occallatibacter riparius]|uniref:beta-N-acetylhexosaminidase n=1 Tax=Occallatibacter riparius TaxID=1002689 RepID=A0A9J7BQR8_9BACT|nr:family 20 glycosylhydrolase [Occallatibacter riparius]UWZ85032.1 family 20 glycosylhydrolase [Occallatibacter riparius]
MTVGSRTRRQFLQAAAALAAATSRTKMWAQPTRSSETKEKIRGLMVDAARVPENLAYYRRVLDFCSDWELNTLQFRLTDDQGTALRFASVPSLITHPHAFSPDELHALATYGRTRGVDLQPEIEAFGHTGYITRSPAYKHLLDDDPHGSAEFTGIIPVHPETPQLFEKLFREVASIFPSQYLHGGCDEVNWGGSALSRKALQTRTRADIWADWLNQLNKLAQSHGKTFIVWGDYVLGKQPDILPRLDKRIVIMDWNYWDTDPAPFRKSLDRVRANGSRGIGAPGLISYRWGPRPGTSQLGNIDAFADVYLASGNPASLGAVLTNWVPSRYIQNSLWDGFAYAAVAFNHGSATARASAFQRFVERHYGAQGNEHWSEAFKLLYDAAPLYGNSDSMPLKSRLPVPFSSEAELATALKTRIQPVNPFPHIRELLAQVQPAVKKNEADFAALQLSVRYLDALFDRESIIQKTAATSRLDHNSAQQLICSIADRDRALLDDLNKDWDTGRPSDSPAKLAPLYGMAPKDQLVFQWSRAAAFSAELAATPDRLLAILRSAGLPVKD